MGRKAFEPNKKQIAEVLQHAENGLQDDVIAAILEIGETTLKKYFKDQLTAGRAKGKGRLAASAMQMATSGLYPAMTIFMCKVRLGMKEGIEAAPENLERKRYTVQIVPMADNE